MLYSCTPKPGMMLGVGQASVNVGWRQWKERDTEMGRAELKEQMAFLVHRSKHWQQRENKTWGEQARVQEGYHSRMKHKHYILRIWQESRCPSVPSRQRSGTMCAVPREKTLWRELLFVTGSDSGIHLDLFLNKAVVIKVISLAVKMLPLILEFPR